MATRSINTRFAIEGESEYRASLARINSEIKSLQSGLKLTTSEYKLNANSMEALKAKGDALNALYKAQKTKVDELKAALNNAQKAESKYTEEKAILSAKIEENNKKLEALRKTAGDTSEEEKKLTDENKELAAQLERCDANLIAAEKGVNSWQTQLNNAQINLNNLDSELKLNEEYMAEAENSADGCATSIDRFGDRVKKSAEDADTLKEALGAAGVIAALHKTAEAFEACGQSAIKYEAAMASVQRTVGGSEEFLNGLSDSFKRISTEIPTTTEELAGIATTAGQLGIARNDVEQFTLVMAQLATTTDLTADNAATMLAQFSNITGVKDYERLGSVVADLGDATATTASKVVDMSQGMAAAASVAGLGATDILAISAAVGSLGIESAAGSTAMSTLISTLYKAVETGKKLDEFASVAGMSAQEFRTAWGNDAAGALNQFIQGLNDTERNGKSAIVTLESLGITNVRQTKAILGLASAGDLLSNTLKQGEAAWQRNTALGEKAAVMYGTTEARLQMLANAADNTKIAIGDKLTPAVDKLADAGTGVLTWLADTIDSSGALVPVVLGTVTALGTFAGALTLVATASKVASAASVLFAGTLAVNPIFLAVTAVAALAAGITALALTAEDTVPSVRELTTAAREMDDVIAESKSTYADTEASIEATASVMGVYIDRLEELERTGLSTKAAQEEYHNILLLISETVPEVANYIDLENNTINGGTEALRANTEAWKENAKAQARQEMLTDVYKQHAAVLIEAEKNTIKQTEASAKLTAERQRQSEIVARMNDLEAEAVNKANAASEASGTLADYTNFLGAEYYNLESALLDSNVAIAENEATIKACEEAVEADREAVEEANAEIELAEQAFRNLTGATDENTDATEGNADAQASAESAIAGIQQELTELATRYKEAYDAAYSSIDGQIGLFDDFATKISADTDTVEEMMGRWATQTENLSTYTENLKKAAQYGLDEGLITSLSDGSTESAGYLATIIGKIEELGGSTEGMGTEAAEFVDEFNASFAKTEEAKESFANTVAGIETDLDNAIANMEQRAGEVNFEGFESAVKTSFASIGVDFEELGKNAGAGLSQGISASAGTAATAATSMADQTTKAAKSALGVHSPSTVFAEIGKNLDAGAAQGIDQNTSVVVDATKRMATATEKAMLDVAKKSVTSFDKEFAKITNKTTTQITSLKSTITKSTSSLPSSMYSVGQQTVNGMINGMNNRSGALYSSISSIVTNAIARAKKAADVRSPSRKTIDIFENVGQGMIVGLEHKRKEIAATAQSVVDNALKFNTQMLATKAGQNINDAMPTVRDPYVENRKAITDAVNTAIAAANDKPQGDVNVNIYSPTALSERAAAQEFRRAQRDLALGI